MVPALTELTVSGKREQGTGEQQQKQNRGKGKDNGRPAHLIIDGAVREGFSEEVTGAQTWTEQGASPHAPLAEQTARR